MVDGVGVVAEDGAQRPLLDLGQLEGREDAGVLVPQPVTRPRSPAQMQSRSVPQFYYEVPK